MTDRIEHDRSEAIGWVIRLKDARDHDWDDFTLWLEADPGHSVAYAEAALADVDLEPELARALPGLQVAANDDYPMRRRSAVSRKWAGGFGLAIAAAAAVFMISPNLSTSRYVVATAAGEHRAIDLGAGSQIALNGSSRITLDHKDRRFASLETGEATFAIQHDPSAPFRLQLGSNQVQDVGTVFNVVRIADDVRVEVAEGEILYNPDGGATSLKSGQTLHDTASQVIVGKVDPAAVGVWRKGRLIYRAAPLSTVAADLARNLGTPVQVDRAIAARAFTGSIEIDRNQPRFFARLQTLLGVTIVHRSNGWLISGSGRAAK